MNKHFAVVNKGMDIDYNLAFILMSFRRSGNTWTRYIIESLTKHPTGSKTEQCALSAYSSIGADLEKPVIAQKVHSTSELSKTATYRGLIILIRNYKEILGVPVANEPTDTLISKRGKTIKARIGWYLSLINYYHHYNGPKMIIYFEDLVESPKAEILKLAKFLGVEEEKALTFMDDYDNHHSLCYSEIYNNTELQEFGIRGKTQSRTSGKTPYYRYNHYSDIFKRSMDSSTIELDTESIYHKYLSRYKEGSHSEEFCDKYRDKYERKQL